MSKTRKNETVIAETEDTQVEAMDNLSAEQQAILENAPTPETVTENVTEPEVVAETNEPVVEAVEPENDKPTVPSIAELKAMQENGDLEFEDLEAMVRNQEITREAFKEILGVEYEEPTTEPQKAEYLYTTEGLKANLTERLAIGRLNAGGAVALITANRQRNEISEETYNDLLAWLKTQDNSITSNAGVANYAEEIQESIMRNFQPDYANLAEAANDARAIVSTKIKQDAEFEGTKVSQLVIDVANIAYYLMKAGELTISYREVPMERENGTMGKARYCKMHDELWSKIKAQKLLGEVEQVVTSVGSKTKLEGTIYDPYSDKSILAMRKLVTMKACLLVYGAMTQVRWGYVSRKLTSTGRMSRNMLVLDAIPEGKSERDFYKVASIPRNELVPNIWAPVERTKRVISVTKDGAEEKNVTFTILQAIGPNDDTSLAWLPDEAVEPWYQHHFANHTLSYHTEERGDKRVPYGSIVSSYDPNFPPVVRKRETTTEAKDAVDKLKEELSKAKQEAVTAQANAAKALAGLSHDNIIQSLQAVSGRIRAVNLDASDALLCTALDTALAVIERAEKKLPGNDTLRFMLRVWRSLNVDLEHDADADKWYFLGPNNLRREVKINGNVKNAA